MGLNGGLVFTRTRVNIDTSVFPFSPESKQSLDSLAKQRPLSCCPEPTPRAPRGTEACLLKELSYLPLHKLYWIPVTGGIPFKCCQRQPECALDAKRAKSPSHVFGKAEFLDLLRFRVSTVKSPHLDSESPCSFTPSHCCGS
ncbi:hypothetical protein ACOMHN_003114 [Nucella lapillus]